MTKRPITVRRVKNAMEKAVREKGRNYVYVRGESGWCEYVRDGAPSCLVGHALFYLGIPLSRLQEVEGDVPGVDGGPMADLLNEYEVPEEVRGALNYAQSQQDAGRSWGTALDRFYCFLERK